MRRENLEKTIVEDKVQGKWSRDRFPLRWIDQVKKLTDDPLRDRVPSDR